MPNRIIKDSINESRELSALTIFAQDLYKRLITYADDYGRFNADTEIMLARLYPRDYGTVTQQDVVEALIELAGSFKIAFYTSAARKEVYGCFPKWLEHQRVRDSKARCPDPDDTQVNDWYLRRFVSIDMRAEIIERDGFKCCECGKFLTPMRDARRFAKLGSGMYHIDHLVPCGQGGRATLENLRLLCPTCNLSRKKRFSFDEILAFSNSPQLAATRRNSPPNPIQSESNPNPIQSESNPNPIQSNAHAQGDDFEIFWSKYPRKIGKDKARTAFEAVDVGMDVILDAIKRQSMSDQWKKEGGKYIPGPEKWLLEKRWTDEVEVSGATCSLGEAEMDAIKKVLSQS